MTTFSSVLTNLMRSKNISDEQLATLVGVNRTTVTRWRTGDRSPKMEKLSEIATVFKVDPRIFVGEQPSTTLTLINDTSAKLEEPKQKEVLIFAENKLQEQEKEKQDNVILANFGVKYNVEEDKKVDIAGKVAAGYGSYNPDKTQPIKTITMNAKDVPYGYDLAFEVSGDSMYPTFEDGEIIFVKKTTEVTNGMIGCVEINGDAFIKKMYIEDGRLRLVSLNNDYDENGYRIYPDFYADDNDEIFIIGKVVM